MTTENEDLDNSEEAEKEPLFGNNTLDQWVSFISSKEMPIFTHTASLLSDMIQDNHSTTSDLSQIILKDPALTSKVLRMANSSYYNPRVKKLKTITRAIVVLGYNTIREISLSSSLLEPLLHGHHQEAVSRHVRRSIHAAVIAKELVKSYPNGRPEETFIAALLSELGHFAFWCFSKNIADKLHEAQIENPKTAPQKLEAKVLGFKLDQLTQSLCKKWNLDGGLLG
ncbi:MAG: HDOD domain-containing protein [Methylococcales bacterium]|jgi:HD-like signal output (HDOD) protein|nr:HDOD domain-containing protein [Methylococcales bacterium]MBT7445274.1 HDOD domain-containing protein [Methylococcales bacterium]